MPQGQQTKAQSVQDVDHAGHSSILAERYHAVTGAIHQLLVVNEANVLNDKIYIRQSVLYRREIMLM